MCLKRAAAALHGTRWAREPELTGEVSDEAFGVVVAVERVAAELV